MLLFCGLDIFFFVLYEETLHITSFKGEKEVMINDMLRVRTENISKTVELIEKVKA